ncbi:hypothetical protein JQK62_22605, partial [Leptospira santarosai]|nr:hypothetical protein [Leptospira santarosai]
HTQGISALLVKLFVSTQKMVIRNKKEQFDVEDIRICAENHFKLMNPMLDAIRSDNPYKIVKYEDIKRIEKIKTEIDQPNRVSTIEVNKQGSNFTVVDASTPKKHKRRTVYAEG